MGIKYVNNSESTLAAGISAAALSLTVQAGHGARFPTIVAPDYFYGTLVDVAGVREVVKVTAHAVGTDVFTIERAADAIQNGTPTAYAFLSGDRFQARLPAAAIMAPDATSSDTFHIDSENTGPILKNSATELHIRNATDAAFADVSCKALTLAGALALGSNAISGVTTLAMAGALSGVTTLAMAGALSGVTTLAMGGALTGATDITASGTITCEHLASTDDIAVTDDAVIGGLITVTGTSSVPIDNEATNKKIKARDHGTASTPEVGNIVYGTGSPPAASSTPVGTIFVKYI
jgi:hypothetical protein